MSATLRRMVQQKRADDARADINKRMEARAQELAEREVARAIESARGPRGPIGPMPEHEWNGSRLRFEIAPNQWGQWTDLQGPPGARGPRGPKGEPGAGEGGGTDLNSLPQALDQPPEEVVIRQGGDWYRIPWADFRALITRTLDGGAGSSVFQPHETVDGGSANG